MNIKTLITGFLNVAALSLVAAGATMAAPPQTTFATAGSTGGMCSPIRPVLALP